MPRLLVIAGFTALFALAGSNVGWSILQPGTPGDLRERRYRLIENRGYPVQSCLVAGGVLGALVGTAVAHVAGRRQERKAILRAMAEHHDDKRAVAAELGLSLEALYVRLDRYDWKTQAPTPGNEPAAPPRQHCLPIRNL